LDSEPVCEAIDIDLLSDPHRLLQTKSTVGGASTPAVEALFDNVAKQLDTATHWRNTRIQSLHESEQELIDTSREIAQI